MKSRLLAPLSIAMLLTGCATISVQTDYDPEVDFSGYKTYGWLPMSTSKQSGANLRFSRTLFHGKLKKAAHEALGERGLQHSDDDPDLLITYHVNVRHKREVYVTNHGYNYWQGASDIDVHEYREGTLILDFIDRRTNQLVWRGIGAGTTAGIDNPQDLQKRLDKAVRKMVADFPPE